MIKNTRIKKVKNTSDEYTLLFLYTSFKQLESLKLKPDYNCDGLKWTNATFKLFPGRKKLIKTYE